MNPDGATRATMGECSVQPAGRLNAHGVDLDTQFRSESMLSWYFLPIPQMLQPESVSETGEKYQELPVHEPGL